MYLKAVSLITAGSVPFIVISLKLFEFPEHPDRISMLLSLSTQVKVI